jgi:hypothetical protein
VRQSAARSSLATRNSLAAESPSRW